MPNWVTHLMIADRILGQIPGLDRRGFCVGSIGPDCNIENEDWSEFMPPREVTHWMRDGKKTLDGAGQFFDTYAVPCIQKGSDKEKQAFMFGYYAHLVTDALFPLFLRDADRVQKMWKRILADKTLYSSAKKLTPSWENARTLVTKQQRMVELSHTVLPIRNMQAA